MAITNYGELKTALNQYLFHQRFASRYDNATLFFERAANRRLRVRQMEATSSLTVDALGSVALPTDYLAWRSVLWTGTDPYKELDYVHPAYLESTAVSGPSDAGEPAIFTIENATLKCRPVNTSADYQLHYYQTITTIVGTDANTNWLLTAHSDLYLFGVLMELYVIGRNMDMATLAKAHRDELFAEVTKLSSLTTGASSPQVRAAPEYF